MGDTSIQSITEDPAVTILRERMKEILSEIAGHESLISSLRMAHTELSDVVERITRKTRQTRRSRGAIDLSTARRAPPEEKGTEPAPEEPRNVFATHDPNVIDVDLPGDPDAA